MLMFMYMLRWWCYVEDAKRNSIRPSWCQCSQGSQQKHFIYQRQRQSLRSEAVYMYSFMFRKKKKRLVERHRSPLQGQQAKENVFAKVIVFGLTSKTLAWDKIHMLHMDLPNPQFHIRNELDYSRIWSKTCLKPEFCKDCSLAPPKKILGPLRGPLPHLTIIGRFEHHKWWYHGCNGIYHPF